MKYSRLSRQLFILLLLIITEDIYGQPVLPTPAGTYTAANGGVNEIQTYLLYKLDFDLEVKKITFFAPLGPNGNPSQPVFAHCRTAQSMNFAIYDYQGVLLYAQYDDDWHQLDQFERSGNNEYLIHYELNNQLSLKRGFYYIAFSTLDQSRGIARPDFFCYNFFALYSAYRTDLTGENANASQQKNVFILWNSNNSAFLASIPVTQTDIPVLPPASIFAPTKDVLYTCATASGVSFPKIQFN